MSETAETDHKKSGTNISRFFLEERHIAWVSLVVVLGWGLFGLLGMPQRKDPDVPSRTAMVVVPWSGVKVEQIEQLVTKKIESALSQNQWIEEIRSISRSGVTTVQFDLSEKGHYDTDKELDDIKIKLDSITDLPKGAGPISYIKDFGDTTALMLTVASPPVDESVIAEKSARIEAAIRAARSNCGDKNHYGIAAVFPQSVNAHEVKKAVIKLQEELASRRLINHWQLLEGPGFAGIDVQSEVTEKYLQEQIGDILQNALHIEEFDPDTWKVALIGRPDETRKCLEQVAGDKYTYRDLDDFTNILQRSLKTLPLVSKVDRYGVLPENVLLSFSTSRLAAHQIKPSELPNLIAGRNLNSSELSFISNGQNSVVQLSGELENELESGNLIVGRSGQSLTYLRNLVNVSRSYESPPSYLNRYTRQDKSGKWITTRAVTISVQMRKGQHIDKFGEMIDQNITSIRKTLPADLILARTSDQPLQVKDSIDLFSSSLLEALILVVIVSWIGFWSWRTALLIAAAIPITFALTFGVVASLGIDLQQISIASLIIALGLLVDVPVVSGDAIKREMATGIDKNEAAWLGPTKLFRTMIFATLTNIISYIPLLLLTGDTGKFLYSLPIVISVSLLAAFFVSITFIPLLGALLLKPGKEKPVEELRKSGLTGIYYQVATRALKHRKLSFGLSLLVLIPGLCLFPSLKTEFFPKDLQYFSYIDVWLPNGAALYTTANAVSQVEHILENLSDEHAKHAEGKASVQSLTSFIGGGGPRFWSTATPEDRQTNYAQVIMRTTDKHATTHLLETAQLEFDRSVPTAIVDTRTLETGKPIGIPVQVRISGEDIPRLRREAEKLKEIFRKYSLSRRIRDDWGDLIVNTAVTIDADKANLSNISNKDVEDTLKAALTGLNAGTIRQGDKQIPLTAKVSLDERSHLGSLDNLYVFSSLDKTRVPLSQVTKVDLKSEFAKIRRFNQYRTITVQCWPAQGHLPSEITQGLSKELQAFKEQLPDDFQFHYAGEYKEQASGFTNLVYVLAICIVAIYMALLFQFKHAVKPLLVFAAIPYGIVGAICALLLTHQPFGFMAFLGIVSLIGVIVSHIIVLFEFIEELREAGEPIEQALVDAAILRIRPVLITVSATVIALFPLAAHGGPLWEALCFAQIGGLSIATFVTLLLLPIMYAIFVLDLKWIAWESK